MVDKVQRQARYPLKRRYKAKVNKRKIEGEIEDISASGVAVRAPPDSLFNIENDQFIELQIENIGNISGRVARIYENGFAIAFEPGQKETEKITDEIKKFRKVTARRKF
ncbi:MAG: PilZ domain-containing protein [Rhodospirillales bacterium]